VAFLIFSVVSVGWLTLRQPETLAPEARRPLRVARLVADIGEALSHRQMQLSILTQTLIFTALFGVLSSIQQVFDTTYGRGDSFPLWFALIALLAAPSGPVNGMLVMRLGMRPMIRGALWLSSAAALGTGVFLYSVGPGAGFAVYFAWTVTVFATAAFTIGNLNALALEPMGHIAGTASSLMGALATVGGAAGGALIGQLYDGTAVPVALCVGISLGLAALDHAPHAARGRGRLTAPAFILAKNLRGEPQAGGSAPYSAGDASGAACRDRPRATSRCHHQATSRTFGTQQVQPI
jgi:DHA1 family bicyclomycin/chloramphenicol resistance-like MFS transporter